MINDLLLLSGNDIPFAEARVTIHQPTLKEIAYIGEETFFVGCGFLNFSKNLLRIRDKTNLESYDDFDIFMTLMNEKSMDVKRSTECALLVLDLIFPLYTVAVRAQCIELIQGDQVFYIDRNNFISFKNILIAMFNLNLGENTHENEFSPAGSMSQRIAEKFKQRHETLMKLKEGNIKSKDAKNAGSSILGKYVSILAVGVQKNITDLMNYTIFQLYDEFQRFQLKVQWDAYVQAKMAGAKDLDEVDHWMINLNDQKNKNKNKK